MRRENGSSARRRLARLLGAGDAAAARVELATLDPAAVATLVGVARAHGVEAWLARWAPSSVGAWAPLAEQRVRFAAASVRRLGTLRGLDEILSGLSCPWAVLKGRAVAEDVYPRPDMRSSVDVDVLVPPARLGEVLIALESSGFVLLDRNWPFLADAVAGELRVRAPDDELVDLHWHLVSSPQRRRWLHLPTDELLDRRRWLPSQVPALHPIDQLLHLVVHAASSGGNRLQWLLDIELSARRVADWPAVLAASRAAGLTGPLALMLERTQRALGTPPHPAAAGLGWRALCRAIDRISPLRPDPDDPALARSFARSARESGRASVAEFARHGAAWLRAGAQRTRDWGPMADPANPGSGLHVVDDDAARARYLATVAAAGMRAASTSASSGADS